MMPDGDGGFDDDRDLEEGSVSRHRSDKTIFEVAEYDQQLRIGLTGLLAHYDGRNFPMSHDDVNAVICAVAKLDTFAQGPNDDPFCPFGCSYVNEVHDANCPITLARSLIRGKPRLFQAKYELAGYATVVIRAQDAHEAFQIAKAHGKQYIGDDVGGVSITEISATGPSEVIIEDWS